MTICLEMVLPVVVGYWLDQWLRTGTVFVLIGACAGMVAGMTHLVRIANAETRSSVRGRSEGDGKSDE